MQQNVVGLLGVAVPIAWPPLAGHEPFETVENVASRPLTVGLPVRFLQSPAVVVGLSVARRPVHVWFVAE